MLLPNILVSPVFSSEEIQKIHSTVENYELYEGIAGGIEENKNIRVSDIRFIERHDTETSWIFKRLDNVVKQVNEAYFKFDLRSYQSIQYTTYDGNKLGNYSWHMDCIRYPRKLSMTIFLNDDYEGGDFEICTGDQTNAQKIKGKPGDAILFPSFIVHRVAPVTKGIRKSLVIWVEGPDWK